MSILKACGTKLALVVIVRWQISYLKLVFYKLKLFISCVETHL
jgi:hypothetical protein